MADFIAIKKDGIELDVKIKTAEETGDTKRRGRGPKTYRKSSQDGLSMGWTRATFIVKEDHLNKLKALAYWERKSIKDVVAHAFDQYFENNR